MRQVTQQPTFIFERKLDGQLSLSITLENDAYIGTGEWGGEIGRSVKYIRRSALVGLEHAELRELTLLLHAQLFGNASVQSGKG